MVSKNLILTAIHYTKMNESDSWQTGTAVISELPAIMQKGPSAAVMPVVT
jgi:hypothetical protein